MKYLIAGLGNIGADYEGTRHNIGFDVVDYLAKEAGVTWTTEHLGDLAEFKHKGRTFTLLKPSTYMNRSGKSVRYWLDKKKIEQENLLVVLDDLNLDFGKQRLRPKGSDGGHNGLKDLDVSLGNNNYVRLRIGIGNNYDKGKQADFVLGRWNAQEKETLVEIVSYAAETVKSFGTIGLSLTMTSRNK